MVNLLQSFKQQLWGKKNQKKLKKPSKKITKIIKYDVNQMLHKHYGCPDRKTKITNNN